VTEQLSYPMGAQESRSQQEEAATDNDGTTLQDDYYTILEVDENATADEIRVSFSPLQQQGCDHIFFCLRRAAMDFLICCLPSRRVSLKK
jgi:hypothetical protein